MLTEKKGNIMPIREGDATQAPVEGEEGYGLYKYLERQSTMTDYHCACGHKWQMEGIQDIPCPKCNPPSQQEGFNPKIPRTSLDRYGEIAYRTAYNPDYATPWEKLSLLTKRKYKAMAKAVLTEAGEDYVE